MLCVKVSCNVSVCVECVGIGDNCGKSGCVSVVLIGDSDRVRDMLCCDLGVISSYEGHAGSSQRVLSMSSICESYICDDVCGVCSDLGYGGVSRSSGMWAGSVHLSLVVLLTVGVNVGAVHVHCNLG